MIKMIPVVNHLQIAACFSSGFIWQNVSAFFFSFSTAK